MKSKRMSKKERKKASRILKMLKIEIYSENFLKLSKVAPEDFTRKAKLNFEDLIILQLNSGKGSMQSEIDNYLKLTKRNISYTKQAYTDARKKIKPSAYKYLNEKIVMEYYKDEDYVKHNGYRIYAIDGSTLRLPNNEVLKEKYGIFRNQNEITLAGARISVLYDVENHLIIDSQIDKYKSSERDLATRHVEKLKEFKEESGNSSKELIIFDRGYPSLRLIMSLLNSGINFLMRVSRSFIKEVNEFRKGDKQEEIIEIQLTKQRIRNCNLGDVLEEGTDKIKLRVLRIFLDSGEQEILITSLMDSEEFPYEEFKKLYFKRWGVEEKYDIIKNIIEVENFTGTIPIAIEQDFYAAIVISNIKEIIESVAQVNVEDDNIKKEREYNYQINKNLAHGKYKDNIVLLLNYKKMERILNVVIEEIQKGITPIRKGRSYPRKIKYNDKYSMNKKRAG